MSTLFPISKTLLISTFTLVISLGYTLPSIAATVSADHIDVDTLVSELKNKREVCLAAFKQDRNKPARHCASSCGNAVRGINSLVTRGTYTSGDLERYQQPCLENFAKAGIGGDAQAEPVVVEAPSLQERLADLPEKNQFCQSYYDNLNCRKVLTSRSAPELVEACNIVGRCSCGQNQIPERLAKYPEQTRQYNMALGQLDQCERHYLQAKELPALN